MISHCCSLKSTLHKVLRYLVESSSRNQLEVLTMQSMRICYGNVDIVLRRSRKILVCRTSADDVYGNFSIQYNSAEFCRILSNPGTRSVEDSPLSAPTSEVKLAHHFWIEKELLSHICVIFVTRNIPTRWT